MSDLERTKKGLVKRTTFLIPEEDYRKLKLLSSLTEKDMSDLIHEALTLLFMNKNSAIEKRFSPTDNRANQLLTTFIELSKAPDIPYAKFLEILGIADSKEARDTYEAFSLFIEKIRKLR